MRHYLKLGAEVQNAAEQKLTALRVCGMDGAQISLNSASVTPLVAIGRFIESGCLLNAQYVPVHMQLASRPATTIASKRKC